MKNITLKALTVAILLFSSTLSAGFYKGLDTEGNVIYSDKPFDNAEQITPPPLTVMDAPKILPKEEAKEEEHASEFKYKKFNITAPKNDQTIWNEPDLIVALQLEPNLNIEEGHTIWLMMDNKPLVKNSKSTTLAIGRSDRGAHQLQAQLRNKKGKIIKRTKTITVHIKNTVVPRAAPN